ncbi:MAG: hypothetical protein AAFY28_13790, partial [Actinomycetota bacterium]
PEEAAEQLTADAALVSLITDATVPVYATVTGRLPHSCANDDAPWFVAVDTKDTTGIGIDQPFTVGLLPSASSDE